jgi:hypothetical protein
MVKTKRAIPRFQPTKKVRTMGPVTAITTAPVAIGNSIRGSEPMVEMSANGCRIRGRDFAFQVGSSVAAATDWTLVGGIPLTPCAMPATSLKSYCQMYGFFKFNSLTAHYITSSPTSQAGDVMFYYERDRTGPAIDCTSNSFLPFVLSDVNTVLGPQWTNHSALIRPDPEFKSTDYGLNADLNEEANGTVFLYSKTNSANSPGYVLFDYDITFKQHQANPRAGVLPIVRAQWSQTTFGQTTTAVTSGSTALAPAIQGNSIAGTAAVVPTGTTLGDVFKVVLDVTNSTVTGVNAAWVNVTANSLFVGTTPSAGTFAIAVDDGFTLYAVRGTSNVFAFYLTLSNALTSTNPLLAGVTATITYNVCAYISLVGSINSARLQNSY